MCQRQGMRGKSFIRLMLGCLGALLVAQAHAGTIVNSEEGYSLNFTGGWKIVDGEREFTVSNSDGSRLTGPKPDQSGTVKTAKVAALTIRFIALAAGLCGHKDTTEFELSGPGWAGHGFHCYNRPNERGEASQMILFAAKRGEAFYPFTLFVPRHDWTTNSGTYLSLLGSLRFRQ